MSSVNDAEALAVMEQAIQYLQDQQAALLAKGVTVATWITELTNQHNDMLTTLSADQTADTVKRNTSAAKRTAFKTGYDSASSKLEAARGALGKNTVEGQAATRIRTNAIRSSRRSRKLVQVEQTPK